LFNESEVSLEVASDVVAESATMHGAGDGAGVEGMQCSTVDHLWCSMNGVDGIAEAFAGVHEV